MVYLMSDEFDVEIEELVRRIRPIVSQYLWNDLKCSDSNYLISILLEFEEYVDNLKFGMLFTPG